MQLESLQKKPIWVTWKYEKTNDGKSTKVPYQINNKKASTTDEQTWTTYKQVRDVFENVGIILGSESGVIGIDLDHCVIERKIQNKEIQNLIKKADTYCEYSPSGTGLHLLFLTDDSIVLEKNKHHLNETESIEMYTSGRYFTFTNDVYKNKTPRKVTESEFISILKEIGYPWKKETKPESPTPPPQSAIPEDDTLLKTMFSARNGAQIEKLYNGDITAYDNDTSSADFALCTSLAFWTQKDRERMRKLWLNSPLANRKKTKERKDYQDRTIDNAIEATTDVYQPRIQPEKKTKEKYLYTTDSKGNKRLLLVLENICQVLETDPKLKGKFRLNDFSHLTETTWESSEWINLHDGCIFEVVRYISREYPAFAQLSKNMAENAIVAVANRNKVNPPREYIMSLVWDKQPRINSWLHHVYGTPDDETHQAMGSNWLKGLVKRVMQPGCQFDEVLALEGPQGWRKSTSIRELGKPWHVETTHQSNDKDFYIILAENVIVEFSEGEILDRKSVKGIKAEVTKLEDQFRPPYGRGLIKAKRGCVFALTTNELELKDDSGNRRWLPVELQKVADVDWIKENKEQLLAEAYYRAIIKGEPTWEYPEETVALQESKHEQGVKDEQVIDWYSKMSKEDREEGIRLSEACRGALGEDVKITALEEQQVAGTLKRALGLEKRNKKLTGGNKVIKKWFPSDKTYRILEEFEDEPKF